VSTFWTAARNRITAVESAENDLFLSQALVCSSAVSWLFLPPLITRSPLVSQFEMATFPNIYQVTSPDHFKDLLSKDLQRVSLLYFWAPWAGPCKQMTEVVTELSKKYSNLLSLQIEAEEQNEISESFDVESVPSFIILRVRRTFIFLSREPGHSDPSFFDQRRVTLYSTASLAQMPAPSPRPLRNMWAHRSPPRLFPVRTSPPRRPFQLWRKRRRQRSSIRASADS
jgi:thiol-disulfide isomerase/thioredoxin